MAVTGLGTGLDGRTGTRSWVWIVGSGLTHGDAVTITGSDGTTSYRWTGTLINGQIFGGGTSAKVHVECVDGRTAATQPDKVRGPGDIIDLDVTVGGSSTTVEDGGILTG